MKHIIVPVDGSEAAIRAAKFAAELSSEAHVTLLFVYDAPAASLLGMGALSKEEMERMKTNLSQECFAAARAAMVPAPARIESMVEFGHPGKEIVSIAKAGKADLIVMGSRGQSSMQEILMGSVSSFVLHHAHCPVTIVR